MYINSFLKKLKYVQMMWIEQHIFSYTWFWILLQNSAYLYNYIIPLRKWQVRTCDTVT